MTANAAEAATIDVEQLDIARVYAEAVWNAAQQRGEGQEFAEELNAFANEVLGRSPQINAFFTVGSIGKDERRKLIEESLRSQLSELLYRLLATLNNHGRLSLVRAVASRVDELASRGRGRARVAVVSATPLADDQRERLRGMLATKLKAEPEFDFRIDSELLGGLRLVVGETVYDYSVRSNLERLRETIRTRSANEVQSGRNLLDHPEGN